MEDGKDFRVKAADIARLDENCENLGIPRRLLMEAAGLQATNQILTKYPLDRGSQVTIFCGLGNNGGDGFVIARHLAAYHINVVVILAGDPKEIQTDISQQNWAILEKLFLSIHCETISDSKYVGDIYQRTPKPDIIIDALLGTGIKGSLREPIRSIIELINKQSCPKVSIDVPSGMDPDTGKSPDIAVDPDYTISFHAAKLGMKGIINISSVSIGIPLEADLLVGKGDFRKVMKKRLKDNHKGQYGRLLVIGGSSNYSGAPALAALSAVEMGIDLVNCFVPKKMAPVIRSYSPNLIVREAAGDVLSPEDVPLAKELCEWASAILIGPGLGTSEPTGQFLEDLLPFLIKLGTPVVIDADGLGYLGEFLKNNPKFLEHSNWILTPHVAELNKIKSIDPLLGHTQILKRGITLEKEFSSFGCIILLKGVYDVILTPRIQTADSPNHFKINTTGCPEMAVGGTGDILAGLAASFCSIGNSPEDCALAAAYLSGLLGESAKQKYGSHLKSIDLIHMLRPTIQKLGF